MPVITQFSEKDIEATSDYLQSKTTQYEPIDGENRIMAAYEAFIAIGSEE